MGWNIYKNSGNNYTIEVPIENKELLLKEEKSNKWVLISNQIPQVILKAEEVAKVIKEIKKEL